MNFLRKIALLTAVFLFLALTSRSQSGNNQIQIAAQGSLPTGDLSTVAKLGKGYSAKGLFGFGKAKQQLTIEINNNFFDIKDKYLNGKEDAYYSTWPIYAGYRRYSGRFFLEGQVGIAFNTITAFRTDTTVSGLETNRYFAWAVGGGYQLKYFEFGARYQVSNTGDSGSNITFIAARVAYRLPFFQNNIK